MDKESIHKELDLIQDVIKRMASNSFEVKKWLIGILTGIIAFKHEELLGGNNNLLLLLLVPVFSFWYLDAFFLSTEKLYREMYKWVVEHRAHTDKYLYDLNTFSRHYNSVAPVNLMRAENNVLRMACSKTLLPFYLVPVVFIIGYTIFNYFITSCSCTCCG